MNGKQFLNEKLNQVYMVDENNYTHSKYFNSRQTFKLKKRHLFDIEQIIVHCTAAGTELWEDPLTCINYDLGANHISRSGCPTCTYHYYLNQRGEVYQCVGMSLVTWHASAQNNNSVAICINHDGFDKAEITDVMYNNLVEMCCYIFDMLGWGYDKYGVMDRIHFHRDYCNKACPGMIDKTKLQNDVTERLKTWNDTI